MDSFYGPFRVRINGFWLYLSKEINWEELWTRVWCLSLQWPIQPCLSLKRDQLSTILKWKTSERFERNLEYRIEFLSRCGGEARRGQDFSQSNSQPINFLKACFRLRRSRLWRSRSRLAPEALSWKSLTKIFLQSWMCS